MKFDPRFPRLHIVDHPLVQHKLSLMRDKRTSTRDFRELLTELAILMGYELSLIHISRLPLKTLKRR